jgi:hypothetical protein
LGVLGLYANPVFGYFAGLSAVVRVGGEADLASARRSEDQRARLGPTRCAQVMSVFPRLRIFYVKPRQFLTLNRADS